MWDKRPEDWQVVSLAEITKPVRRKNDGGDHPVMTISAKNGFLLQSDKYSRDMAGQSLQRYALLREGEFAYNKGNSKTAPQGCIFRLNRPTALLPFVYYCFSLGSQIDPGFAAHAFGSGVISRELARYINAGVRNDGLLNLYEKDFYRCSIALPPYPEQVAIAEVLQSIEDAIACKCGLIAQLERTADAVFQDALYPGGAPRFPLAKFGDAIESTKYGTSVKAGRHSEGYAVLGIPNIVARRVKEDALNRVELSENEAKKYSLKSGDLLAVRTNGNPEYVGRMALIRGPMPTTIFASYLIRIRLKKSVALPEYIEACAPRWPLRISLTKSATTSAGNFNVNTDGISQARIILPPIDVQQQVVKLERAFQDRIEAESRTLSELQNTHRALAQELLSGRLRLPASMIARFENAPPSGKTSEAAMA